MASNWEIGKYTQQQLASVELAPWGQNAMRYRATLHGGAQVWLRRMSDVIDELSGGELCRWNAERIVEAAEENPGASPAWLAWAPVRARDQLGEIGTELHTHIQGYLERGEWPEEVSEPVALLLQSWSTWWSSAELVPAWCERYLADLELGVGGTGDLMAHPPGHRWRETVLVDWKSSTKLRDLHRLQVIGYAGIWSRMTHGVVPVPQMVFPDRCILVHVHRDGSTAEALDLYTTQDEARELYFVFLNLVCIHHWRRGLRNESQRLDRASKREQLATASTTFCE